MSGKIENGYYNRQLLTWELMGQSGNRRENSGDIHGVLFLDVDGTLTRPGSMYAIESESMDILAEFIDRGGVCVFNTGATLGRLERTVLNEIFQRLDKKYNNFQTVTTLFRDRVIAMPENGSAVCVSSSVDIVENELYFSWHIFHALDVPDKEKLRTVIETELVPLMTNSIVVGDHPGEKNARQYILSWKGVTNTLELVEKIKKEVIPHHSEIQWNSISMKAARKTIDFIHADSGKMPSSDWVLHESGSFDGPVLGFGDLGDEFGKVIPTINVNQVKPNEFRRRRIPGMELTRWELLNENGYVVTGDGKNAKVRHKETDDEINVVRDENGAIIYSAWNENGYLTPTLDGSGCPVAIKPFSFTDGMGKTQTVQDAGKGTAWVLRRFMDKGYFSINKRFVHPGE